MKVLQKAKSKVLALLGAGVLLTGLLGCFPSMQSVSSKADHYQRNFGIGYGTNVISDEVNEASISPILDLNYIDNNINTHRIYETTELRHVEDHATSYSNFIIKYNQKINELASLGLSFKGTENSLLAQLENKYSGILNLAKNQFVSQYYYFSHVYKVAFSQTLDNSDAFLTNYQNHFSAGYLENLSKVKKGTMSYTQFFDLYGTHFIAGVKCGGSARLFYSASSTVKAFDSNIEAAFSDQLGTKISDFINVGTELSWSLNPSSSVDTADITTYSDSTIRGGNESLIWEEKPLYQWVNSLSENTMSRIGYTNGGLIPLWDILPTQYSTLKSKMKKAFDSYKEDRAVKQSVTYDEITTGDIIATHNLRTDTTKIEDGKVVIDKKGDEFFLRDCGRWANPHDTICLSQNVLPMKTYGYKDVKIEFSMTFRADDQASDRTVFFYQNENANETGNNLINSFRFVNDGKYDQQISCTFTTAIENLPYNKLVLRYTASGAWDDDWYNRNIKVKFTFSKGEQ